jgi:hypothetical protein
MVQDHGDFLDGHLGRFGKVKVDDDAEANIDGDVDGIAGDQLPVSSGKVGNSLFPGQNGKCDRLGSAQDRTRKGKTHVHELVESNMSAKNQEERRGEFTRCPDC